MDKENAKNKLNQFIKTGLVNVVVVGVGLAYIFFTMITIKTGDVNVLELLGKSAIGIICGIMIKQGLGENGITRGYGSDIWNNELLKYNDACNKANPYMERVDNFYYYEEIEKRKSNRRSIMMGARLKYSDFFDEYENFVGQDKMEKLTRYQKRAVERCVKIKVYTLNLFSEYASVSTTDTKKETGDKEQRAKMFGKNSISQILVAVAGAYFVPMFNDWDWGTFIFSTLQVLMWAASGVMQMYTNYNYIVIDKVNKLKRKKELIEKFVHGCTQDMYKENPYEVRALEEQKAEEAKREETKIKELEVLNACPPAQETDVATETEIEPIKNVVEEVVANEQTNDQQPNNGPCESV